MSKTKRPKKLPEPLNEDALKGVFLDGFGVGTIGKDAITLAFITTYDGTAYVFSRIVLTVERAKDFVEAINEALKKISE